MTKDLFEGGFVGAGSRGFAAAARTGFHRREFEQKEAKGAKIYREYQRAEGYAEL